MATSASPSLFLRVLRVAPVPAAKSPAAYDDWLTTVTSKTSTELAGMGPLDCVP